MVKLLAIDMDGTLLSDKKHIAEEQKRAIKEAINAGVHVVLCTGRPLIGVLPFYEELALEDRKGYAIVNNGCAIHNTEDWSIVDYEMLSKEELEYLHSLSEEFEGVNFTLFDDNNYLCIGKPNKYTEKDGAFVFTKVKEVSMEEILNGECRIYKTMYVGEPSQIDEIQEKYGEKLCEKYNGIRSQVSIYETMPHNADKSLAIKRLAERLGIDREEVMAMGDGNNDVKMLKYAGVSVAMGNSTEDALKAAKFVTDTNENDGVAKAIDKYILGK